MRLGLCTVVGQSPSALRGIRWHVVEWRRYFLALIAALCLAGAFPPSSVAGFAWLGPGCLAGAALGSHRGQAFRIGYMAGLIHHLISLSWLLYIPVTLAPVAGWIALAGYLALYQAVWTWCVAVLTAPGRDTPRPGWDEGLRELASAPVMRRLGWPLLGAIVWVGLEMLQARLMSGFPWNLLGASQYRVLPLIQLSSITGVYGLSFLLVWFSLSLVVSTAMLLRGEGRGWAWIRLMMPACLGITAAAAYGSRALFAPDPDTPTLKATLVQPSIPQTMIWDPAESERRFEQLIELSEQAMAEPCDLLIWPEAGVPGAFRYNPEVHERITEFARKHRVWLVFGAEDLVHREGPREDPKSYNAFNSSFLLGPDGVLRSIYHKRRLVIFGEYVPLGRWFPFLKYLTPIRGGFASGKAPVPFVLSELGAEISVLICFEDVFPHYAREHVGPRTDFLVNLTNNGWFGESAAQWQHAANAVFRAVENRAPLVRCTNNGLTCLVDSKGRVREMFRDESGSVYGRGFLRINVPLQAGEERQPTFYNRWGDMFGWWCVAMSVILLAGSVARRLFSPGL